MLIFFFFFFRAEASCYFPLQCCNWGASGAPSVLKQMPLVGDFGLNI